jgi:Ca2+-binding EF-hand superfamily protein
MDTNGDGKLDSNEIVGRTESYLAGLGFDTSKPILISAVAEKIRAERGEPTGNQNTNRATAPKPKVPGFGATNEKVAGFGSSANQQSLESQFSAEIIHQVEWTMQTYDRNQDGFLDESEMAAIPAGTPPLKDSDTDRDGKLSRLELAYRYQLRSQFASQNENGRDRGERLRNDQINRNRGRFSPEPSTASRDSGRSSNRSSSSGTASSDNASRTGGSSNDDKARIQKYVDNIFEKYDTDGDGKLSKSESSEIRNPPKADADGYITKEAYTAFLIDPTGSQSSSNAATSSSSTSAPATNSRPDSSRFSRNARDNGSSARNAGNNSTRDIANSSSTRSRTRNSFDDYDLDGNGMIEMHEYSDEWNDKILEEFYQKDKNRDGVITRQEWNNG